VSAKIRKKKYLNKTHSPLPPLERPLYASSALLWPPGWHHAAPFSGSIMEFLTYETTCASEMLEKTTCEIFCQKRPPTSGGTAGRPLPPLPLPARSLRSAGWALPPSSLPARSRVPPMVMAAWCATSPAANGDGGMWCATSPAANGDGGMWCATCDVYRMPRCRQWQRRQGPAGTGLGGTCHVSPGQGWGSFLTKNFAGGLF
jgi:hypothetical protein